MDNKNIIYKLDTKDGFKKNIQEVYYKEKMYENTLDSRFKWIARQIENYENYTDCENTILVRQYYEKKLIGILVFEENIVNKEYKLNNNEYKDLGTLGIYVKEKYRKKGYGNLIVEFFYKEYFLKKIKLNKRVFITFYPKIYDFLLNSFKPEHLLPDMDSEYKNKEKMKFLEEIYIKKGQ